ncbi:large subunit ribosomal protein L6 [Methylomagnum ishizawai]|uniref:Large ribosomal subunit protein uL6 n=1 Tax=Methylomagnum ishizawai TaxID=1760988 RepID=A0A1Y6D2B7_9GAMM|nr:50S ribosomal protein L6 [Methylomagnum ishizawai]SMF96761.1 large subunit ribosomal protein L6 [Methylomagnum ishizawai]
MSRIAKNPIPIPKGVEAILEDNRITVKGGKGVLSMEFNPIITVAMADGQITISYERINKVQNILAGTTRANIANMVSGVNSGYERKLNMVGVGYRAQAKGNIVSLSLGYSHPVEFPVPEDITVETPTQTEIVIKGCDKQKVGQVAANIRSYRPPEPYKGKGVRYSDEQIIKKEAKKK